ncbi:MAG: LLM class flavin-dependent oxidoreductase, partial [Solirubrobacteraceae bacterium]
DSDPLSPRVVSFDGAAAEHDPDVRDIEQVIDGVRWALVEYAPRAGRTEWCHSPHSGYVLNGELRYEFEDGSPEMRVVAGQAFRLPAAPAHRAQPGQRAGAPVHNRRPTGSPSHRLSQLMSHVSFGIATAPQRVAYVDVLRVWREADVVPEIEHAWLFDHLMPIGGDRLGPIFEGWTLLSALAAQTSRLRVGLLVTSNRFRPPAMMAKIATTVDVVSGGRLDFGIGAGSRTSVPEARREYDAHGLPYVDFADSVDALAEACTVIKRLWTESAPFDFDGRHVRLVGAFGNPKPVQQPRPPILIAGRTARVLRVVAEHADVWNIAGVDVDDAKTRSGLLDRYCSEIGRQPASITRSSRVPVSYDDPATTRDTVATAVDAGFTHVVLSLSNPYPDAVVRWVADEIVTASQR